MHDYDPNVFDLGDAKLVQQPIYDQNAELVLPWKVPFVLVPGALIAAEAKLFVYHFLGKHPRHVCYLPSRPSFVARRSWSSHSSTKSLAAASCFWTHPQSPTRTSLTNVSLFKNKDPGLRARCSMNSLVPVTKGRLPVHSLLYVSSRYENGVLWFYYLFPLYFYVVLLWRLIHNHVNVLCRNYPAWATGKINANTCQRLWNVPGAAARRPHQLVYLQGIYIGPLYGPLNLSSITHNTFSFM